MILLSEFYKNLTFKIQFHKHLGLVKNSGLFDAAYYLSQYPDLKNAGMSPEKHFLLHGGFEGRRASADFHSGFYLDKYADVKESGVNPLIHYILSGKKEGRDCKMPDVVKETTPKRRPNPLESYFLSNKRKLIHKWDHYFDIYHKHFHRFRNKECVLLEIGVSKGGSLQMWKDYFGPKARIIGVDIDPESKKYEGHGIEIIIGSQSDRAFLRTLRENIPSIDILIDDGGHFMQEQIIAFEELFSHIRNGGIYLCEDTHTSYWPEFDGGHTKPDSFIEYTKSLIDTLNAWHIREKSQAFSPLTKQMTSLHFYDSVFIIEKKLRDRPVQLMSGGRKEVPGVNSLLFNPFLLKLSLLGIKPQEYKRMKDPANANEPSLKMVREKFKGRIWPEDGETMIGYKRLTNIENCIKRILNDKIEGDLIETGVWRGGACIFMRALLKKYYDISKIVWVADSFEGLPKPDPEKYPGDKGDTLYMAKELAVSLDEVKANFEKYQVLDSQLRFLKGWFKDTIPTAPINKLALLRLDGDMYESTIDVLFYLYPKLSVGGFCIIDDWEAVRGCKSAVNDYRRIMKIDEEIIKIDWTGVFWRKKKEVVAVSREEFTKKLL